MKTSSGAMSGPPRHWWQAHPMAGLTVGWIAIGLVGWRVYAALFGHHA